MVLSLSDVAQEVERVDRAGCRLAWLTPSSVCECVHESLNVSQCCKALLSGHWLETRCINAVHLPFTILPQTAAFL